MRWFTQSLGSVDRLPRNLLCGQKDGPWAQPLLLDLSPFRHTPVLFPARKAKAEDDWSRNSPSQKPSPEERREILEILGFLFLEYSNAEQKVDPGKSAKIYLGIPNGHSGMSAWQMRMLKAHMVGKDENSGFCSSNISVKGFVFWSMTFHSGFCRWPCSSQRHAEISAAMLVHNVWVIIGCSFFCYIGSAKTDPVRFKWGFGEGLLKRQNCVFLRLQKSYT